MTSDPIECFQIATTYIAEGDYKGAIPLLEVAAKSMAGFAPFDDLLKIAKTKGE